MAASRVRPIREEERQSWLTLRKRLWPDHDPEILERERAQILADPEHNEVFVALGAEGDLIGFLEVSIRPWAEGCVSEPVGYLEGWYVEPGQRRRGVGRALVLAGEAWARSKGCSEMGSDTEGWNEAGQRAHAAVGYREAIRLVCFSKQLV
jgi:aminoglycoside 6'-N-acetyltransferase I